MLKVQLQSFQPFTEASMQDAECVQFYTGLPNFLVLYTVFEFVAAEPSPLSKLSSFQEFIMVLIKLRMNLPMKDLAYHFQVSVATTSRIWLKWLVHMDGCLGSLIMWPGREDLQKTMPCSFQSAFGNRVAVIIDCFEVFIERPSNLLVRRRTSTCFTDSFHLGSSYSPRSILVPHLRSALSSGSLLHFHYMLWGNLQINGFSLYA